MANGNCTVTLEIQVYLLRNKLFIDNIEMRTHNKSIANSGAGRMSNRVAYRYYLGKVNETGRQDRLISHPVKNCFSP